jgi:hypothetical protein
VTEYVGDERLAHALDAIKGAQATVQNLEAEGNKVATAVGLEQLAAAGLKPGDRFEVLHTNWRHVATTEYWLIGEKFKLRHHGGYNDRPVEVYPEVLCLAITKAGKEHGSRGSTWMTVDRVISKAKP